MKFGTWEIPEDEYIEEVKRYESARATGAKSVIASNYDFAGLDEAGVATVYGSGGSPYECSLESCDCADFERRGYPCKHMIFLALNLGVDFDVPEFDPYKASEYDIQEDISRLTDRWRSGQLTFDALSKCVNALKLSASKSRKRRGKRSSTKSP